MSDPITAAACAQRDLFLSFREHGPRVEIVSPYPQNTKFELDMRRKTEILKYKQQTSNSNIATKSKKWSQIVRLSHANPMAKKNIPCPEDALRPTPTSACGVPGPIVTLQYDPTVPLYKYGYNPERYNLVDPPNDIDYTFYIVEDAEFEQSTPYPLFYLVLKNPTKTMYDYQFQTPVAIYFSGYKDPASMNKRVSFINITLSSAECEIHYNNIIVPNVRPRVDKSKVINILLSVNDRVGYFEAAAYIGIIYASNIILPAQPQYVYTFDMKFEIKYVLLDDAQQPITQPNDIKEINYLTIGNITGPNDRYFKETNNCSIIGSSPPPYDHFYLSNS